MEKIKNAKKKKTTNKKVTTKKTMQNKSNNKKNKITILIIVSIIIISLLSVSYAIFTPVMKEISDITTITSGELELTISDGDENIVNGVIGPGVTLTKTFTIRNSGTYTTTYDLYLSEVYNTFIDQENLVYELIGTDGGCSKAQAQAPSKSEKLNEACAIEVGETHQYTLNITYIDDPDHDQSENIGKQFGGKLKLNEVRDLKVTYNYYLDGSKVEENPRSETTELIPETSSCTNGAIINYDENTKEYSIGNITKDSTCTLYYKSLIYNVSIEGSNVTFGNNTIEVIYGNTNTVTITPNEGYYISGGSCSNGYTIEGLTTGTSAIGEQTITINNNSTTQGATCTITTAKRSFNVSMSGSNVTFGNNTIEVEYGNTNTVTVTPTNNYYISGGSCTNGYTITGMTTGTSATGTQTITINNNNKISNTTCTITSIKTCEYTVNQKFNYSYTGGEQSITLACTGKYKLEVWGAKGGGTYGGKGGYSYGTTPTLAANTKLYVYVGGQGVVKGTYKTSADAGYNGGGALYGTYTGGSSGGGATDIRIASTSLYARVIVAGGGGGSAYTNGYADNAGGYGGGTSGGDGYGAYNPASVNSGTGASATSAGKSGSFGVGANGGYDGCNASCWHTHGAGGGGGWYGGGVGGDNNNYSGGGGSGYVYTSSTASNYPSGCLLNSSYYLVSASTIAGNTSFTAPGGGTETGHSGNGYARITYLGT